MSLSQKVELMAPVGSFESLQAALNAGADSIFFGVTSLNMRAKSAKAFTINDIEKICSTVHNHGKKAYLTLNTVVYDYEMTLLKKIIEKASESHIDAIIASDISVINVARKKNIPLHISTQMSISNIEGVRFWANYADVIVLARELTLPMIQHICSKIQEENICGPNKKPLQIEIFSHGALCISISGRCGMSLYGANMSANRGLCKQFCRRPYIIKDKKSEVEFEIDNEYVMSPKDICTLPFLDKLIQTGVHVLKIEGRGRSPDYVDTVIRTYREAIDAVNKKNFSQDKVKKWMKKLETVYNRGFSDGYYLGKKLGEWSKSDNSLATEQKHFAGIVNKYFVKAEVAEIQLQAYGMKKGDTVLFTGPTTGILRIKPDEIRDENTNIVTDIAHPNIVTIKVPERVRKNDKVFIVKKSNRF